MSVLGRWFVLWCLVVVSALWLTACGQQAAVSAPPHFTSLVGSLGGTPASTGVGASLDDISSTNAPDGVDPALYVQLRDALLKELDAQAKGTSAPPSGDANLLDDITWFDNGGGDWTISWTYKNRGDYDLNGEVNVADLTPIGQNFRATPASGNWATAQAADGDQNGEVNLADVTQIGQYYRGQVGGYNVYGGPENTGPWTLVGTVDRTGGDFGVYPAQFEFHLGTANDAWYLIVPRDFVGVDNVGNGGGGGGNPVVVNLGTVTPVTSGTIGPGGGTIEAPAGSELEGVRVTIPVGTVSTDTNVTLGVNNGSVTPEQGEASGQIIELDVPGAVTFTQPIEISVPLDGSGRLPVPYYIHPDGTLGLAEFKNYDPAGGRFSFVTWHDSPFTYFWDDPEGSTGLLDGSHDSGFRPSKDGFLLNNTSTSTFYPDGRCTGFTAFSQWYFKNKSKSLGQLYPRYATSIQGMTGLTSEEAIVTRAYTSVNVYWNTYMPYITAQSFGMEDISIYGLIRNAIANTKQPQILSIQDDGFLKRARHSVLAYSAINGTLAIYDPNHPTIDNRAITMTDDGFLDFDDYVDGGIEYSNVYAIGDGSLYIAEPYQKIFEDAEGNFQNFNKPKVTVESHADGAEVTSRFITMTGKVTSVEVLVDQIELQISVKGNVDTVVAPVDPQGNFSVVVPLRNGENGIVFVTRGVTLDGRRDLPNTQLKPFIIKATIEGAVMLVTLSWNLADTDVDLYVTDPLNATSWYSSKVTGSGGELDVDNTSGFGPEHWTLSYSDTIQYGQPYRVGVHYYSDRDHGAVSGTVTVLMYEGSPSESTRVIPFSIGADDMSNNQPGGSGGDWFYLDPITLEQL